MNFFATLPSQKDRALEMNAARDALDAIAKRARIGLPLSKEECWRKINSCSKDVSMAVDSLYMAGLVEPVTGKRLGVDNAILGIKYVPTDAGWEMTGGKPIWW